MRSTFYCWCLLGLFLLDCSGETAADLYRSAEAEEARANLAGARVFYERIVREFPESAEAGEARARLTIAGIRGV